MRTTCVLAGALVLATLACQAGAIDYSWNGSTGPWTDAARWAPAGGPPGSASDTGTISAGTAQAGANLGTAGNQPTIQASGTGKVQLTANTSGHTFVLDGGKITMNNPGRFGTRTMTDTCKVQNTGTFEANGDTSVFYVNGLLQDGAAAGKVFITSLVPTGGGACTVAFSGTAPNTYSGGTQIDAGGLSVYVPGGLGTGNALVKNGAFLRLGSANVTAPSARITVESGGKLQLGSTASGATFSCSGHTIELLDGAEVQLVQPGRFGSCTTADTFLTIGGTASFRIPNDSGKFYLDGAIQDGTSAGKIWYRTQNVITDGGYYVRAANTYTGGTDIENGARVWVTNAGGLSTGPIKVATGGSLYLDLPTNANWNLANNLAGAATIQVETGTSSYTLTATGSTINPGNTASAAGTLTIAGNLAFARNGATPVTLNIDVLGTGSPVVVSNDQLAVTRNVSGLSNAVLNVSISGATYQDLAGKTLPILTCTNDLTGQAFSNVTYPPGWTGVLTYGNGSVTLALQASQAAPPSTITDLAAGTATASTVTLSWTAPGAHGTTGTATNYDIRYSTATITDANWDAATPVAGEPTPQAYGTPQNMMVTDLIPNTTYFFAIKSLNDTPATSALSNVPSAITRVSDDATAPAAITDLAANYAGSTHLILAWTAPGDDANTGTASSYDIRYSTSPITDANWAGATPVLGEPAPAVAGTKQSMNITGLLPGTDYYFATKTADEVPNWSFLSNVAMAHTRPASSDVIPPAAVTDLAGGWPSGSSLDVSWTAPGDDGSFGTATAYDLRYSKSSISDANWDSAARITYAPVPAAAGNSQKVTVIGLDNNTTYYFALKTADEDYNWSPLSNIASYATTGPDVTSPSQVTDLAISNVTATSVDLSWTVTGNDGMFNLAAVNDIRYSTLPITSDVWFYTATKVTGEPVPTLPGTSQSMTVTGLNEGTTYYFAIRVVDPYMNWSSLSNVPSATTLSAADVVAPAAITNLVASHPSSGTVRLDWTAPGDDGNAGTAATYEIRFATSAISEANWPSARQVSGVLAPQVAGTKQTWTVYGLLPDRPYYFAMKAVDEAGNRSALSNVATAITLTSSNLNKPVLTRQDFEYLGAFKLPYSNFGQSNAYADSGIAIRHVNGNIQILTGGHRYTGDAIYECTFPGWGPDSSTWPQATTIREWGTAVYDYPRVKPNITGQTWTHGVMFDEATGRFYFSWGPWYNIPPTNYPSLGYAVLNESGPVVHGPWAGPNPDAHCQKIRGGSLIIPDWFATAYLGGRKLGLGFGGYYSGWSGNESARGTFLAAAHHPDDSTAQLDTINLIDHTLSHWGPRDADYWTNTVANPVGDLGSWAFADNICGGSVWIDLPDKHGLLFLPMMGHGNIPYIHSAIYPERREGHWWIYDPKDLAAVAQGTQQPWDPQADSWIMQYNPRAGGEDIPGCAFDPQTRTLFVIVPSSYDSGGNYWQPLIHGWRIKETPPIRLVGDINNDGFVNVGDLQALVAAWGSQKTPPSGNWNPDADINSDNFVNVGDLQLLVAHWGEQL